MGQQKIGSMGSRNGVYNNLYWTTVLDIIVRDSSNGETVNVKVRQAKWPGKCHNKMLLAHGDVIVSNFQQGQRACQLKAKEVFILKVPRV